MEKTSLKTMTGNKMNNSKITLGELYSAEIAAEETATRKCLERIPLNKIFDWKPHEKSMQMGSLAIMVAGIPAWIKHIIEKEDIDFATWKGPQIKTTKQLVEYFDKSLKETDKALKRVSDMELEKPFSLKREGKILITASKREIISSLINHWIHHRGQLTVYMRLKGIMVPSIYGPSADDNIWK